MQRGRESPQNLSTPRRGSRRAQSPQTASPTPRSPGRPRSPGGARSPRSLRTQGDFVDHRSRSPNRSDPGATGTAVNRLRNMLRRHQAKSPVKSVQFSDRPFQSSSDAQSLAPSAYSVPNSFVPLRSMPLPRGEIPTPEECVPILQNQAILVQQLEAENKFCKEELHVVKVKLREILEENVLLHDELKRSVIQEILQEGVDIPQTSGVVNLSQSMVETRVEKSRPMNREDYNRWQKELERIHSLHTAKASRLEAQLEHARDEAKKYEKETEDLRKELRMRDSLNKADPGLLGIAAGLCIRCATNEAIMQPSGMTHGQSHATLIRERDELMEQLAIIKTKYEEVRQREDDMYEQVKRSVEMVEQTQLEETELILQRDQYKEELTTMQRRVAEHAEDVMNKMAQERELVRQEFRAEKEELALKVKELTESLVETQNALEKTTREKISLIADLETAKGQVDICDLDYGKATDNMKMTMTQATIERNAALREMAKLKKDVNSQEKERDQERSRLKQELYDLRRRLEQAEKELVETKEECIHLHNTTQSLERESHLAKLAKQTIEKTRGDDLKNMQRRAEQREAELNALIDQLEGQHLTSSNELEKIVSSQSSLIQRLREECRQLAHKLEDVTVKYRTDNKNLKGQNDQLKARLDKSLKRQYELEDQHTQHGSLQDKMRHRLREMDDHSTRTGQQVLDLLAKESALMRDRQLLAKEVEFLRQQMLERNEADISRFYSSQRGIVDGILLDVNGEEMAKIRDMAPERDLDAKISTAEHDIILEREDLDV